MKLFIFSLQILPCLALTLSPLLRAEETNWETYTNDLGYTAVRFKEGFEPGSDDYDARFGGNTTEAVVKRQDNRVTEPLVGSNKIYFGCDVNVGYDIIPRLYDVCSGLGCDAGSSVTHDVKWSDDGLEKTAQVILRASGRWPDGMLDSMIEALQAEVITEALDIKERTTRGGGNSPFNPIRINKCTSIEGSNYYSIVVRGDNQALIGQIDLQVTFVDGSGGGMCGIIGSAGGTIIGLINGIAGGIFGIVRDIACQ